MEKKDNNGNGVIQLEGRVFKRTKLGLDEEQVLSFVNELISQRDTLLKRQEHLSSLAELAEKTVTEADSIAQQIKQKAVEQAKAEADEIVTKAVGKAKQIIEEKKVEAITMAEKEAEVIRANAQKQAELMLEEKTKMLHFEVKGMAQRLYGELLSQSENLKQQIRAMEADFEQMLSQSGKEANPIVKEEENNTAPSVDSGARSDVMPNILDTGESEKEALSPTENQETSDYKPWIELEVLPPVDIPRIMGFISHLESLREVRTTELIPVLPNPLITVFLSEPLHLTEVLRTFPDVQQAAEVTDDEVTATADAPTEGKRKKIQVMLGESSSAE